MGQLEKGRGVQSHPIITLGEAGTKKGVWRAATNLVLESVLVLHLLVLSLHMHVPIAIVHPRRLEQQTVPLRVVPLLREKEGDLGECCDYISCLGHMIGLLGMASLLPVHSPGLLLY